jgi:hypothetical protein
MPRNGTSRRGGQQVESGRSSYPQEMRIELPGGSAMTTQGSEPAVLVGCWLQAVVLPSARGSYDCREGQSKAYPEGNPLWASASVEPSRVAVAYTGDPSSREF